MTKDLFVSYVTVLDTLQNIARLVHADPFRKIRKKGMEDENQGPKK